MKYFGFVDPSGGGSDSMTLGIAHATTRGDKVVLAGVWERKPPFNPDAVTEEFAGILKSYRVSLVAGDRYAGEWPRERFRAHGITYVPSDKSRSEIYLEFLVLVNSARAEIPSGKRLRTQLVGLERRTSRMGRDTVDHAPSAHDDLANAAAGALVLTASATAARRELHVHVLSIPRAPASHSSADPDDRWWRPIG